MLGLATTSSCKIGHRFHLVLTRVEIPLKTAQDLSGLSGFSARFERFERFARFGRFFLEKPLKPLKPCLKTAQKSLISSGDI